MKIRPPSKKYPIQRAKVEVEVENVADESKGHYRGRGQLVAGIAPTQQIKATVKRKTGYFQQHRQP